MGEAYKCQKRSQNEHTNMHTHIPVIDEKCYRQPQSGNVHGFPLFLAIPRKKTNKNDLQKSYKIVLLQFFELTLISRQFQL